MKDLSELNPLLDTYQHFALCKGAEKLIPYNNKNKPAADQIELIKTRLNSPACPAGEYLILCKNVLRNDVKPDEVIFFKEGPNEKDLGEPSVNLPDRNKYEFEAFKLQFLNDKLKEELAAVKAENESLFKITVEQEAKLAEFEEQESLIDEKPEPAGILSEATLKPFENILQILAPIFQPLLTSYNSNQELKNKMKIMEFNFEMKRKYNTLNASTAPTLPTGDEDDEFIKSLRELKKQQPETYNNIVDQLTAAPQSQEQPEPEPENDGN
jgi:hypothetical protein